MNLNYYVLGKEDSPMLLSYLDKYYNKLISDLKKLSEIGFLTDKINLLLSKNNRDFILSPDQSSIINLIYAEKIKKISQGLNLKDFENKFELELTLFLDGKIDKLSMNLGDKIGDTNIRLTNIDNNPYSSFNTHPDHTSTGGVKGLGEAPLKDWLNTYNKTFDLLKKVDQGFYSELNQIIKKIICLGTSKAVHNSCLYKECIGHLYMGYTIDSNKPEINNLEAIIHESSHNKLNLLMQFDKLVLNDKQEKYYSPYRPDARHIHGVWLGIHAFVPTVYIMLKAYYKGLLGDDKFLLEKLFLYHLKNKLSLRVMKKHSSLTCLGKEVLDEIVYVMKLTDDLTNSISINSEIINNAKLRLKEHFIEVNKNYSLLEY